MQPPGLGGLPGLNFCFLLFFALCCLIFVVAVKYLSTTTSNQSCVFYLFQNQVNLEMLVMGRSTDSSTSRISVWSKNIFVLFIFALSGKIPEACVDPFWCHRQEENSLNLFHSVHWHLFWPFINFCVDLLLFLIVQLSFQKLCRYQYLVLILLAQIHIFSAKMFNLLRYTWLWLQKLWYFLYKSYNLFLRGALSRLY